MNASPNMLRGVAGVVPRRRVRSVKSARRSGLAAVLIGLSTLLLATASFDPALATIQDEALEPAQKESGAARTFEASLAALHAYEASLPSLAWHQTMQQFPVREGRSERKVATWNAELAFSRDGRWQAVVEQSAQRDVCYFDGNWIHARSAGENSRVIRAHQTTEVHHYLLTPHMFVTGGRFHGGTSPFLHMLSDDLEGLQETEVDDSGVDHGGSRVIRLSGSRMRGDKWVRIEATLDVERGYMPTSVVVVDELSGVVRQEYRVTSAERIGEIWIPTEGTRWVFTLEPTEFALALATTPEGAQLEKDLEAWKQSIGLDLGKRADRRRLAAKLTQLAGGSVFKGKPTGGIEHETFRAWNFRVLDDALAAELLKPPFDEGDKVFDSRTREICYWRGGKLVKEDGTPVVLDAAAAAKPAVSEPKPASPSSPTQQPPEATPAPKPQAENAKP